MLAALRRDGRTYGIGPATEDVVAFADRADVAPPSASFFFQTEAMSVTTAKIRKIAAMRPALCR